MNRKLTMALGAAALTAILAQPARAGHPALTIGIGIAPPAMVAVVPAEVPRPPVAEVYNYHYYPRQQVYYDPARGQYFWLAQGRWYWGPRLPGYIVLGPRYLPVQLRDPWPHHHHPQMYRQHPPHDDYRGPWRP
ncbi:MAG: hypothetical protein V1806_07915 [Pseudomonadota bacterium]